MADIVFDSTGKIKFPTKYHGEVTLSKWKWEKICGEPERYYYRFNGEKVPTTLINPDCVKHHRTEEHQFLYYKEFGSFKISENVEGPLRCKFFAIVIDVKSGRVCTVYPTDKPKLGKEFKIS